MSLPVQRALANSRVQVFIQLIAFVSVAFLSGCPRTSGQTALDAPSPGPAESQFRVAEAHRVAGEFEQAAAAYAQFVERFPFDPARDRAAIEAALSYLRVQQTERAENMINGLAPTHPVLEERLGLARGLISAARGRHADAIATLFGVLPRLVNVDEQRIAHQAMYASYIATGQSWEAISELGEIARLESSEARTGSQAVVRELVAGLTEAELAVVLQRIEPTHIGFEIVAERAVSLYVDGGRAPASELGGALRGRVSELPPRLAALIERPGVAEMDGTLVGVILPLSGPSREVGQAMLRGCTLAIHALPGQPRARFRMLVRDDRGDPALAEQHARELVRMERVALLIGPTTRDSVERVRTVADENHVPMWVLTPSAEVTHSPYVLRLIPTLQHELQSLLAHLPSQQRVMLISPQGPLGDAAFLELNARRTGATEVRYVSGLRNFTELARQAIRQGPDAVVLAVPPSDAPLIVPALAAALPPGATRPTLALVSYSFAPDLLRTSHRYIEGALVSVPVDLQSPDLMTFRSRFVETFGQPPDALSVYAYDAMNISLDALVSTPVSRDAVLSAINQTRPTNLSALEYVTPAGPHFGEMVHRVVSGQLMPIRE